MNDLPRLHTAFESAPVAMACLDLQGRLFSWNKALERFLGCTSADLAGVRLLTAFTPPQDAALEAERFLELVDGQRDHYYLEKRYLRKDRQVVWGSLNVSLVPAEGPQQPFCLSIIEDVTDRRRQEEHLRQTAKMDALARMAGEVVFRLNQVMLTSLGSSQLLLESLPEQAAARDLVVTVRDAVDRSAALTRQLMAFCQRQILSLATVDLNALLRSALPQIRRLAGDRVEVITRLQPQPARVDVDRVQIERALLTLVQNAIEAMPDGGKLIVQTAPFHYGDHPEGAAGLPEGPHVVLSVTDTGCGMDERTVERLYEPFFTTKEQGRAGGLGLAAVYGIVKQCGGQIEVDSQPGHGTTLRLCFPRTQDTKDDLELPSGLTDTRRAAETVLLVEEDDALRGQLRRLLRAEGYQVLEARYGGEALLLCLRHEGPIHLMVANAVMPHLSGRELAEQAAPLRPDMRMLLLTQHPDQVTPLSIEAGHDHLPKPITPAVFAQKLRELLGGLTRAAHEGME
jgi:PAS domain S-box-containing protein